MTIVYEHLTDIKQIVPKNSFCTETYDNLFKLLFELRKTEKRNWKQLLNAKNYSVNREDVLECLKAKPRILNWLSNAQIQPLLLFMVEFVLNAPINRSVSRVFFLQTLICNSKIGNHFLKNCVSFLHELSWKVEEQKKAIYEECYKPMKESEKIMNWKFKDFVNLKMNVQKLHKSIAKCVNKLHEHLLIPSRSILNNNRRVLVFEDFGTFADHFQSELDKAKQMKTIKRKTLEDLNKKFFHKQESLEFKPLFEEHFRSLRILPLNSLYSSFEDSLKMGYSGNNSNVKRVSNLCRDWKFKDYVLPSQLMDSFTSDILERAGALKEAKKNFQVRFVRDLIKQLDESFNLKQTEHLAFPDSLKVS